MPMTRAQQPKQLINAKPLKGKKPPKVFAKPAKPLKKKPAAY